MSRSCRAARATRTREATTARRWTWKTWCRSAPVAYDPVWIFYRAESAKKLGKDALVTGLPQMRGWRLNVGVRGSGTPGITSRIFAANFVERDEVTRSNLDETAAVVALLGGELDAAVLVSPPESQMVQMLLQTPGIRLYEYGQAESYARRYPFLGPVALPRGVADIARDVPPHEVPLIATTTVASRARGHPSRTGAALRPGGLAHPQRPRVDRARRDLFRTRARANSRSPRTRPAITRAGRRSCSAIFRSGSPT
jgi:hypothetical protein